MEEVDNLILLAISHIGTEIPDGVSSLKQLATETFVEACGRCINVINGNEEMPTKLPGGMSARFRVGTTLSTAIKELGYPTEIGYNTFLYSNEADARSLLMWLVEKLPKESADSGAGDLVGKSALFQRAYGSEVGRRINVPWAPTFCTRAGLAWRGDRWYLQGTRGLTYMNNVPLVSPHGAGDKNAKVPEALQRYYDTHLQAVTAQPPLFKDIAPSVLEENSNRLITTQEWEWEWTNRGVKSGLSKADYLNKKQQKIRQKMSDQLRSALMRSDAGNKKETNMLSFLDSFSGSNLGKGSKFSHQEKLVHAKSDAPAADAPKVVSEEELRAQREAELKVLQDELDGLLAEIEALEAAIRKFNASLPQIEAKLEGVQKENTEREEQYKVRKTVLDLLPNADANIKQLQDVVDASAQRLLALSTKWEEHRTGLIQTYRKLRDSQGESKTDTLRQLDEIKQLREDMQAAADVAKSKEVLYKQLTEEFQAMNKDVQRSAYTRRILEIVRNIQKQKLDISKVLVDTFGVQKEINQVREKLDRVFHLTDELIFKDAKTDESCKQAYKSLAGLHENCSSLVNTVEETGNIMREIRDLEDQVEAEQRKNMAANLARISADYDQIRKENAQLQNQ